MSSIPTIPANLNPTSPTVPLTIPYYTALQEPSYYNPSLNQPLPGIFPLTNPATGTYFTNPATGTYFFPTESGYFTIYGTALVTATSIYQNGYQTAYSALVPYSSVATALGVWSGTFSALFGSSLLNTSDSVYTQYDNGTNTYQLIFDNGNLVSSKLLVSQSNIVDYSGPGYVNFVNALGTNLFPSLLKATTSVINQQNDLIYTYYSSSLSYQVNISNLSTALEAEATFSTDLSANFFSSYGFTYFQSLSLENVPTYTYYSTNIDGLLNVLIGHGVTNSAEGVTEIQAAIAVQQNYLSNATTFLNSAVSTLQSQISLAGQIIQALSAAVQAVSGNIR